MKNILTLILFFPLSLFSQIEEGRLVVGMDYGFVQDVSFTDLDVNEYSPDMSSTISESDKGLQINVGYKLSKVTLGVNYKNCNITGENDIEYHQTKFNERNIFIEYDLISKNNFIFFVSGAYGSLNYDSKRYLLFDNTEIPINSPEGDATKFNYGYGIKILLGDNFMLSVKTTRDTVEDDGFDGWDYGTDIDKFSYHSVGLIFLF